VARFSSGLLGDFRNQTPTLPNLTMALAADPNGDQQKVTPGNRAFLTAHFWTKRS
jgi:hypothetical protein